LTDFAPTTNASFSKSRPAKRVAAGIAAVALAIAAAAFASFFYLREFERGLIKNAPAEFRIPRGASLGAINQILIDAGVLPPGQAFIVLAKLRGFDTKIQAGKYKVAEKIPVDELSAMLIAGEVVVEKFTIIEGARFADVRAALADDKRISGDLAKMSDADILRAVGAAEPLAEGLFFPDTYLFNEGADGLEILRSAHQKMSDLLAAEWDKRAPDLPLDTPYQALILASIIEKESAKTSERDLIASVFINRLRRGMRLQADPTVIYGIADFNGNITRADLRRDTPYNTYTRGGLPPTPIALPGAASLHAALHPRPSDYLYFVATGEDGAHYFSKTLREHNRAVRRYQKKR
jgi:UPF0755 protein